jgi:spore coat protein A, manganese oxidase
MKISRRRLIKWGLLASACIAVPLTIKLGVKPFWQRRPPAKLQRFQRAFRPLPRLEPVYSDRTTDYYEMAIAKAQQAILPGTMTEIWGYGGITPGPTIRQSLNRKSVVRVINHLGNDAKQEAIQAVVHLHGMGSLPQYDGYAMDAIAPEYFKDYQYNNSRAATLWYHDHMMDLTWRNVTMGQLGLYIVEDPIENKLNLPQGDYDIPLILEDKEFSPNGSLVFNNPDQTVLYDQALTLVNGVPYPRLEVANRKYRFRLLNGATRRYYKLALSQDVAGLTPNESFTVIANDGGLLPQPVALNFPKDSLRLAMAERYEIVIDFSQYPLGTQLYLQDYKTTDGQTTFNPVMRFDVLQKAADDSVIPQQLKETIPIAISAAKQTRRFEYSQTNKKWTINGHSWADQVTAANPQPGDVEIWELVNPLEGKRHPVHMHLVDAQLLDRNGKEPLAYERGRKDVFHVGEQETVRVIIQFPADIRGKYMMHCHDLQHEDNGMMSQFELGTGGPDPIAAAPAKPLSELKAFSSFSA